MQASQHTPPYLFYIVAHDIILLSGVKHSYGIYYFYFIFYSNFYSSATCEELFNLWHAKAQNFIERSFGVIKWQFKILVILPEMYKHGYSLHLWWFTTSFMNGILSKSLIYYLHLMIILIWLRTLDSWQQSIQDKQRKGRSMQDMISAEGTLGKKHVNLNLLSLITQYYEIKLFAIFHGIKYNNKGIKV